jgi:glucose dehydrogenase
MKRDWLILLLITSLMSCKPSVVKHAAADYSGWTNYAGSKDGARYSSATQLNVRNVARLKVAWIYRSYDKDTGLPLKAFGAQGYIDLSKNLNAEQRSFVAATSPGIIYKNLLITGIRVAESQDASAEPIRAYDVMMGQLRWSFNTIPRPGEKGYESWEDMDAWKKLGGANSWAGMSLDENTGVVGIYCGYA